MFASILSNGVGDETGDMQPPSSSSVNGNGGGGGESYASTNVNSPSSASVSANSDKALSLVSLASSHLGTTMVPASELLASQTKMAMLQQRLKAFTESLSKTNSVLNQQYQLIDSKTKECVFLKSELERMKKDELNSSIEHDKNTALMEELAQLKQEYDTLNLQHVELIEQRDNERLESELNERVLHGVQQDLNVVQDAAKKSSQRIQELENELQMERHSRALEKDELQRQQSELQHDLNSVNKDYQECTTLLSRLRQELIEATQRSQDDHDRMEVLLEDSRALDVLTTTHSELVSTNADVLVRLHASESAVKEKDAFIQSQQAIHEDIVSDLRKDLEAARKDITRVEQSLADSERLRTEVGETLTKLKHNESNHLRELEQTAASFQLQLEKFKSEIKIGEVRYEELAKEKKASDEKYSLLNQRFLQLESDTRASIHKHQEALLEQEKQHKDFIEVNFLGQIQDLNAKLNLAGNKQVEAEQTTLLVQKENKDLKKQVAEGTDALVKFKERVEELEAKEAAYKRKIEVLETELETMKREKGEMETTLQLQLHSITDSFGLVKANESHLKQDILPSLEEKLAAITSSHADYKVQLQSLQKQLQLTQKESDLERSNAESTIAALKGDLAQMKGQVIPGKDAEISRLQELLSQSKSDLSSQCLVSDKLRAEVQAAKLSKETMQLSYQSGLQSLKTMQVECDSWRAKILLYDQTQEERDRRVAAAERKCEENDQLTERKLQECADKLEQMRKQQLADLSKKSDELAYEHNKHLDELDDLKARHNQELDKKDAEMDQLKAKHEAALQSKQAEITDLHTRYRQELALKHDDMVLLKNTHFQDVAQLKEAHERDIRKKDEEIASLIEQHKLAIDLKMDELTGLLNTHRLETESTERAHRSECDQLKAAQAAAAKQHQDEIIARDAATAKAHDQFLEAVQTISYLKVKNEALVTRMKEVRQGLGLPEPVAASPAPSPSNSQITAYLESLTAPIEAETPHPVVQVHERALLGGVASPAPWSTRGYESNVYAATASQQDGVISPKSFPAYHPHPSPVDHANPFGQNVAANSRAASVLTMSTPTPFTDSPMNQPSRSHVLPSPTNIPPTPKLDPANKPVDRQEFAALQDRFEALARQTELQQRIATRRLEMQKEREANLDLSSLSIPVTPLAQSMKAPSAAPTTSSASSVTIIKPTKPVEAAPATSSIQRPVDVQPTPSGPPVAPYEPDSSDFELDAGLKTEEPVAPPPLPSSNPPSKPGSRRPSLPPSMPPSVPTSMPTTPSHHALNANGPKFTMSNGSSMILPPLESNGPPPPIPTSSSTSAVPSATSSAGASANHSMKSTPRSSVSAPVRPLFMSTSSPSGSTSNSLNTSLTNPTKIDVAEFGPPSSQSTPSIRSLLFQYPDPTLHSQLSKTPADDRKTHLNWLYQYYPEYAARFPRQQYLKD